MLNRLCLLVVLAGLICPAAVQAAEWSVPGDFATIQAAIDSASVLPGDTILVGAGSFVGATVTKAVEIKGQDGAVINDGPSPWNMTTRKAGFFLPEGHAGDGATISHFRFEGVQFPVFSRGADNVTVSHNVMISPVQGVTNWKGAKWDISNNEIIDLWTMNGGGIGILIGDNSGSNVVQENVIAHNRIHGTLFCGEGEKGGYNGTGVVLYSDYRYGRPGGEISYNRVLKNKVSLVSDCPSVVDVAAFEMTDTRNDSSVGVIHDNAIGFNDFRGTTLQIVLTPDSLDTLNPISRNLGENRGHGLHPSAFGSE